MLALCNLLKSENPNGRLFVIGAVIVTVNISLYKHKKH